MSYKRCAVRGSRRRASAVAVAIGAGLALAGCGTQTVVVRTVTQSTSSSPASAPSSHAQAASARRPHHAASRPAAGATQSTSAASGSQQAGVGDALSLQGNNGEALAVTVDQVLDPMPAGVDDAADPGQRFVGVQITLHNMGTVPYSDSPSNGATLLTGNNEQAKGEIVSGGPCGTDFQSSVNIAVGDTEQGCVPFEVPDGQSAGAFQFTLDSGFGDQTGQWSLAGAAGGGSTGSTVTSTTASSPATATTATTDATPSDGGGGPIAALTDYWQNISGQDFTAAFADLSTAAVNQTESQWISGEQQDGITGASFDGHVTASTASSATVDVDSLVTHDSAYGCRNWSGSYDMTNDGGRWLIAKARISPSPCS